MVATINLSFASCQPINALSPVDPLSSISPKSFEFEPVFPDPNSISASSIVVFVAEFVTVEPLTVRLPVTTTLPAKVAAEVLIVN